ncbi:hypothetical protein T310_9397 [Rasamsonia emersonii CBS 393.64]|uniref:Uncharacterized protein n=1 Tax=Rasamsonia emersonii (strain ATCC 16479 / CBS 393.64 / IMI 116815) TaxID=1408163 RepID=A0A0F4YGB0_RASE3|nr:hypothetical protein T310_9397 [Rasamsonia emersonii CBS 393.64]KKA16991.1 hypothetical protein T310_9397 [Rasamsonia emersonii CBS 393.64]
MLRSNYSWCALPRIIERYEERQENLRREHPPAHARFESMLASYSNIRYGATIFTGSRNPNELPMWVTAIKHDISKRAEPGKTAELLELSCAIFAYMADSEADNKLRDAAGRATRSDLGIFQTVIADSICTRLSQCRGRVPANSRHFHNNVDFLEEEIILGYGERLLQMETPMICIILALTLWKCSKTSNYDWTMKTTSGKSMTLLAVFLSFSSRCYGFPD